LEPRVLLSAAYTVTDLGTLPGDSSSFAQGINSAGEVVGYSQNSDGTQAPFLWTASGAMSALAFAGGPPPGGFNLVIATDINDPGNISATAATPDGARQAFVDRGSGLTALGFLSGGANSTADAINSAGQVAGSSDDSTGNTQATIWSSTGVVQGLGYLSGGASSAAAGINDNGQVAGSSQDSNGRSQAFIWTSAGGMKGLGFPSGSNYTAAAAINSFGQIVVTSFNADGSVESSYVWSSGGGFQAIGTLSGTTQTIASGINNAGQVVGEAEDDAGDLTAFLWTSSGGIQNLNNLIPAGTGWTLRGATAINASGQIVGQGINPQGQTDAFLLSPPGLQPPGVLHAMITAPPISAGTASPESITVIYNDTATAIDTSTIAGSNLTATTLGGSPLNVTVGSISGSGASVTAIYNVAAPNGSWSNTDNGTYPFSIAAGAVKDMSGTGVSAASGSFTVNIAAIPPGPFSASISDNNIPTVTAAPEPISVTYTDSQSAINTSSIAASNLSVTFGSTPLSVTLASVTGSGGSVSAVYAVPPPHGSWTDADNGTYNVSILANSVTDQAGGGASAASASFVVAIPSAQPSTPLVDNSVLQPVLAGTLPKTTLVAGGKIVPIHQTVRVKNTGSTTMTGMVTVNLLLSTDPTGQSNGTSAGIFHKRIALKPGRTAIIPLLLRALPAAPVGSLYLLPEVTDPAGNTSFTSTSTPVTVAAPFIDLTGSFFHVPTTARAGKTAVAFLTVVNNGNVAAAGMLAVDLQRSDTSTSPATVVNLGTLTHRIALLPHRLIRLRITIPLPPTGGPFFVTAALNSNNAIAESDTLNDTFSSALIRLR
jgi:probable HAF family extracellular repeat protein